MNVSPENPSFAYFHPGNTRWLGCYLGGGIGAFMILTVDPVKALWFVVYIIILQQIEGNLIYPKVMGNSVNLSDLWILAAVTIGSGLAGPAGILLSVSLLSTAFTLFAEATDKRKARLFPDSKNPPTAEEAVSEATVAKEPEEPIPPPRSQRGSKAHSQEKQRNKEFKKTKVLTF